MPSARVISSLRFLGVTATLFALWYLLSGKTDAFHLGAGALGVAVIALVHRRGGGAWPRLGALLLYVPWLLGQIVLSNLHVARLVFSRALRIRPTLVRRPPGVRGDGALTLLGCSITLTPGTLTIDVNERELLVHALDHVSASSVEDGSLPPRVLRVFPEGAR